MQNNTTYNEQPVEYFYAGGFWRRLFARMLDELLLSIIVLPLTIYNMLSWKIYGLYVAAHVTVILYKPLFEYKYGATPGKMALDLQCVNNEIQNITLMQAFTRNIFFTLSAVINIVTAYMVFNADGFADATDIIALTTLQKRFTVISALGMLMGLIVLVDGIMLISNRRKISLHDRIAGTMVVVPQKPVE
jgi:uncharacterized RDD family membrane protein YckC